MPLEREVFAETFVYTGCRKSGIAVLTIESRRRTSTAAYDGCVGLFHKQRGITCFCPVNECIYIP
jgi:hypothetical protein